MKNQSENTTDASDATVRPVAEPAKGMLTARVLSALVLALPVLAAVYFGTPWWETLIAIAGLVLAWEWTRLCGGDMFDGAILAVATLAAVVAATLSAIAVALVLLGFGCIVLLVARRGLKDASDTRPRSRSPWLAAGALYIGLPCVALIWLRNDPSFGRNVVFWLLAIVWAADCGAYLFGKVIGGPRLAPTISPTKTWAGFIGGVACAGATGAATAVLLEEEGIVPLTALSAFLGAVGQGGDLTESWIKRRVGVKDSSNLIPGHGGLFDRVDALLAATLIFALIGVLGRGGVISWS